MTLSKLRLGSILEKYSERCNMPKLSIYEVSGVNKDKEFFEPSKQVGSDTSNYRIVPPGYFACNLMHIGRDCVLPIALNNTSKNKVVSPAYTIFKIKNQESILSDYLFIYLNSTEKDRYFWFNCDSSVRDGMDWEVFCDIEIEIPPIEIQKKYVAIYKGLKNNLKVYESNLEDLKLVCDGYVENLRKKYRCQEIGSYITKTDRRNTDNKIKNVKNVSVYKSFNEPTSKVNRDKLSNYKIVYPKEISFVQTTHNEKVFAYALNNTNTPLVVTPVNEVFKTDERFILPEFLCLYFNRREFDRYARFHSWGSARETFVWNDLQKVKIPIPPINIQRDIVDIYNAYSTRKLMIQKLKDIINNICPILIRGAIREASEE